MTTEDTLIPTKLNAFIIDSTCREVKQRYAGLPAAAAHTLYGELDEDVVVIDTETTGVSFKHDELTQIAAARMQNGEITDWYVTFVNPRRAIPEAIQHLTNIHESDVATAPIPEHAIAGLVDFVGSSPLIAHNAAFDRHFVTRHSEGAALRKNIWIDTLDLARIALPRMKSHRLIDLARAFGIEESTHRADDDVATTCQVYRVLLAAVDAMPKGLVNSIATMATVEEWPTAYVFSHFSTADSGRFSLHDLRRKRTKKTVGSARADAESLVANGEELRYPSEQDIQEAFDPSGVIAQASDAYEARSEQIAMSQGVATAFRTSRNLAVEAGTGVGKSMAYLVPAVLLAKRNGITVGVATKTNNLLDQLVNKELPLLDQAFNGVAYAALKGFSHYPCLRKVAGLLAKKPQYVETQNGSEHQAPALAALLSFIEQSEYDDIDSLKINYHTVPRYLITTDSQECLHSKCPFFGKECFVHGARQRAASCDVVVTNHSLLFCDLAVEGSLLPPIRHWIVDEAHSSEDEGRRAFSFNLQSRDLRYTANRVAGADASKNVFVRAARRFGDKSDATEAELINVSRETSPDSLPPIPAGSVSAAGEGATILYHLASRAAAAGKRYDHAVAEYTKHVKDLLYFDTSKQGRGYERVELWINDDVREMSPFKKLTILAKDMQESIEKLITCSQEVVAFLDGVNGAEGLAREIAALIYGLKEQLNASEIIFTTPSPTYAYAAELFRKRDRLDDTLSALMLSIGQKLNETLFARTQSVIFTSATLTVDGSFEALDRSLGLNESDDSQTDYLQLDSSYDFDEHMTVYVPTDMPDPNESGYLESLQTLLVGVHRAEEGSTLSLFTNRREMETCYEVVENELRKDELRVVCQKWGVSVKGLRDDFVSDEHLSLFALKSFWEGFDAPGATLKAVVISKLPFKKPSDPLSRERSQDDPHAWAHYVLPPAVLETKQAAGRLIRSAEDTGNLIIADHRVLSKGYGKKILRSLPSRNIKKMTISEIVIDIARRRR